MICISINKHCVYNVSGMVLNAEDTKRDKSPFPQGGLRSGHANSPGTGNLIYAEEVHYTFVGSYIWIWKGS